MRTVRQANLHFGFRTRTTGYDHSFFPVARPRILHCTTPFSLLDCGGPVPAHESAHLVKRSQVIFNSRRSIRASLDSPFAFLKVGFEPNYLHSVSDPSVRQAQWCERPAPIKRYLASLRTVQTIPARFERATYCLGGSRSILLSYGTIDLLGLEPRTDCS